MCIIPFRTRKEVQLTREDEIFRQIKQGNKECLDELVRMYYPEIFRYCVWHTKSMANAEDAVQETFLKAVKHLDRYTHKGKFRAFLYQIAANTCIDMRRRKCEEPMDTEILETFMEPAEIMGGVEDTMDFLSLVENLTGEAKEIILLRFGQELKLREIAAVMGLPLRTVQSRLRAALRQLERLISEKETAVIQEPYKGKGNCSGP